jgi:sugar phosphate permease
MYIGLTIGSLLLPWVSEKFNKLNEAIMFCGFGVLIVLAIIIYAPALEIYVLKSLLLTLGIFCGAEMMCFTGALLASKKLESGQVIGVVNTLNMLGGAIVQQTIGTILDMLWDGRMTSEGIRYYSTEQFQSANTVLTVVIAICCITSFQLLKLKKPRS